MSDLEGILRAAGPRVLAAVTRRFGDFGRCEDAVQEALLAAAGQWPRDGVPADPAAWLIAVAARRRIDDLRRDEARRRREDAVAVAEVPDPVDVPQTDDTLTVLLLCCHPVLSLPSQVALTLRAVGGLTTAEIARALLVPETTVGQRISRAKVRIRATGTRFELPPDDELGERVTAALRVLYLIFNEGYAATSGARLTRVELSAEAIRLTRELHERLPDDGEVTGLLALMLLTDARRPARTDPLGRLVALADQDRSRWDAAAVAEGVGLVSGALATSRVGPFLVQAAIAAVHDEAATAAATDWVQILGLYEVLQLLEPGPMVTLSRIVAVAMVSGPLQGLRMLEDLATQVEHHRIEAVRAHLLELSGERAGARASYRRAARTALSVPEQRYLESRAVALSDR